MAALRYDDTLEQGADWILELTLKDPETKAVIDLTNYTVSASLKTNYTDASPLLTITAIFNTASQGKIRLSLNPTQIATIGNQKQFLYDCFITDTITGLKYKIVKGVLYNDPKVT